jgi:CDP-diacylglycerol---serine O-phosphatidyltransferase
MPVDAGILFLFSNVSCKCEDLAMKNRWTGSQNMRNRLKKSLAKPADRRVIPHKDLPSRVGAGGKPGRWLKRRPWRSNWADAQGRAGRFSAFLPNLVTLASLCLGLSAVVFAFAQDWRQAVASVLIAGILDGLDGRLARMLKASSEFGAQLDSLADFINFGVAPALILYCAFFQQWGRRGWGLCLFFAICMAMRLARFNVQRHAGPMSALFSTGVPAPAGALMALTPLMVGFVFEARMPIWLVAAWSLFTAGLLISRYPTFVVKTVSIPQRHVHLVWGGALAVLAGLASAPWETLLVLSLAYSLSLPISWYIARREPS